MIPQKKNPVVKPSKIKSIKNLNHEEIKNKRWGQSKKTKRRQKKKKKKKIKKRINLHEFNFTIKYMQNNKEKTKSLTNYLEMLYSSKNFEKADKISEEDDYGNIEYKLKLVDSSSERVQHLATQMKFRLEEGSGEAFYKIGYEDNGTPNGLNKEDFFLTLSTLCYISRQIKIEIIVLKVLEGTEGKIGFLKRNFEN